MKLIKVYVVEDMAISRASLETMLLQNEFELSGSAAKAETAWEELQKNKTDLILLDINLSGVKNGVWLAKQVRKHLNIPIVFLTAYSDQQTLKEVMNTKPNGYLMKPYQEPTLLTTINIALNNFANNLQTKLSETENNFIYIKDSNLKVKLFTNEINYIMSDGNYLEIHLEHKKYVIRSKMTDFETLLPENIFFQSHRRYLVNSTKINAFGKDFIQLGKKNIPLSSKYKSDLENTLLPK